MGIFGSRPQTAKEFLKDIDEQCTTSFSAVTRAHLNYFLIDRKDFLRATLSSVGKADLVDDTINEMKNLLDRMEKFTTVDRPLIVDIAQELSRFVTANARAVYEDLPSLIAQVGESSNLTVAIRRDLAFTVFFINSNVLNISSSLRTAHETLQGHQHDLLKALNVKKSNEWTEAAYKLPSGDQPTVILAPNTLIRERLRTVRRDFLDDVESKLAQAATGKAFDQMNRGFEEVSRALDALCEQLNRIDLCLRAENVDLTVLKQAAVKAQGSFQLIDNFVPVWDHPENLVVAEPRAGRRYGTLSTNHWGDFNTFGKDKGVSFGVEKTAPFAVPWSTPPTILASLTFIDLPTDKGPPKLDFRKGASTTKTEWEPKLYTWDSSSIYMAEASWIEIANDGTRYLLGQVAGNRSDAWSGCTREFDGKTMSQYITFTRPFTSTPKVVAWVRGFGLTGVTSYRLKLSVTNISEKGFTLTWASWDDSDWTWINIQWFAYPSDGKGVEAGMIATPYGFISNTQPWWTVVKFKPGGFSKPPPVLVGFYLLDVKASDKEAVRLKLSWEDLTATSVKVMAETWWQTKMYQVGLTWAAVE